MYDVGNEALDWVWNVRLGRLYLADSQDVRTLVGVGYSGAAGHQNRPESEALVSRGPIPRGVWRIQAPVERHPRLGPVAIPLEPADPQTALKRSGFFVHGDNSRQDGTASTGCIILNRKTRDLIKAGFWSGIRTLVVLD